MEKTISRYRISTQETNVEKKTITSSTQASKYLRLFFFDDIEIYESFFMLFLNNNCETIAYCKISQGGVTGTVVDPKIVGKYIVDNLCTSIIICHNHPSGYKKPSIADLNITQKIKEICKLFDCKLMDHIILTKDDFYSFADNGDL